MNKLKVVLLLGQDESSRVIFNALKKECVIIGVFLDKPISKFSLFSRRSKKIGLLKTIGQVAFILFSKLLYIKSKSKLAALKDKLGLDSSTIPSELICYRENINHKKVISKLRSLNPDLIFVNGTRIISSDLIRAIPVRFVNIHVGITPNYRGVHGGYWALASNDKERCGVTVHIVDEGIDTGEVLYQKIIQVNKEDNFFTYPLKQTAAAIPLLKDVVNNFKQNNGQLVVNNELISDESRLWYHPTLVEYLSNYLKLRVK